MKQDIDDNNNYELVCPDLTRKSLDKYETCNFDATLPRAIFMRKDVNQQDLDNRIHGLTLISNKFGKNGSIKDVFTLFGEFEPNVKNVIFSHNADKLVTSENFVHTITENLYEEIHCKN